MDIDNNIEDLKYSNINTKDDLNNHKKYQKQEDYNKLLPYYEDLEKKSEKMLADIKGNLGQAVMYREIDPGCILWTGRLEEYIELYSYKFSKQDHIYFVKLYYELITTPNIDPYQIEQFTDILIVLLRKKKLLSPDDLVLPWRPLYELYKKIRWKRTTSLVLFHIKPDLLDVLPILIRLSKTYFPLNATQEILDLFKPSIRPNDEESMSFFACIEYFLPIQLPPQHHSFGYKLWFNEFMNLWNVCHNNPSWGAEIMWLMARLAHANIGYIDWEPYIPLMFARFPHSFSLPVAYKKTFSLKNYKMSSLSIATWIVSVLGNKSSAQMYLEKFLKSIETYFQAANVGKWSRKLKEFLLKLSQCFIYRINKERNMKPTWETPIPDKYKLTDEDIDAFVKSMMPLTMASMFNKFNANPCSALKYLATIRPNLVIPQVVDKMYSALDSLTEPHKLTATILGMTSVAKPMVQGSRNSNKGYEYVEGPMHVVPILFSLLPGIDPNDIGKTAATLSLISSYGLLIPFVDSSKSSVIADEEERLICEMTSRFEDFILQFLDRIFIFIDTFSLDFIRPELNHNKNRSKLEEFAEDVLKQVFTFLLLKTSDAIFLTALHKLKKFISERILETMVAGELVAIICRVFANINGQETLSALMPILSETILDIIGEGDDILKEENLDNRLLYSMLLLSVIADTPGRNLLPYMNTFVEILDKVLLLESRDGRIYGLRLLGNLFRSLRAMKIYQFKTHGKDFNDPEYPYTRHWGEMVDINSIDIKWYILGKEEFEMIQKIFFRYLIPQLETLQSYCQDWTILSREKLLIVLKIVIVILTECEEFLPYWEEPPLTFIESSLKWTSFDLTCGEKFQIVMPDGSNVRKYLVEILSNLQDVLLKHVENNRKPLINLIYIWDTLICSKDHLKNQLIRNQKELERKETLLGDKLDKKKMFNEYIILQHAIIRHKMQLQMQSHNFTETHKNIMLKLLSLGTSGYSIVRLKAQNVLASILILFPLSYIFIVPSLEEILEKDTEIHHDAYKGALFLLINPDKPVILQRNWHVLRSLWVKLILSKASEKPSIIRLEEIIRDTIKLKFQNIVIELEIPDRCVTAASKLWDHFPYPTLLRPDENEIQKGVEKLKETSRNNLETYYGLLDDLLNAMLERILHWRHRLIAMDFIQLLANENYLFSSKMVKYFLETLINDSLHERTIAINIMVYILKQQKRKHTKVPVHITDICKKELLSDDVIPGERADNAWLLYDYNKRPTTSKQWDEQRFVHHNFIGYYTWPKMLEFYVPSSEQPTLDPKIRKFTDQEIEVERFFDNSQNVEKIIQLYCMEEVKEKENDISEKFELFEGIFRNHGITPLKHFLPHLHSLVKDKQESKQRCLSEIISGIIRGSKHWPFEMICEMWNELLPIIRLALDNITVETISDWTASMIFAMRRRDPYMQHWLIECLMEEPIIGDFQSSFIECARLHFQQVVISTHSWRSSQLIERLLIRLENRLLANPFKNLRFYIGELLFVMFEINIKFSKLYSNRAAPQMRHFINKLIPKLQILAKNTEELINEDKQSLMSNTVNNFKSDNSVNEITMDLNERITAIRLLKIICKWIKDFMYSSSCGALPEFYLLIPIICQMENYETDKELVQICTKCLSFLAQSTILPNDMPIVLDAILNMSTNLSWLTRITCLEFLQTTIFYNMSIFIMKDEWVNFIKSVVINLLEDTRLEVREKAGHVLSGLLHCRLISNQNALLEQFKVKVKTKLYKRDHSMTNETEAKRIANVDAIRLRHARVLGLCAFIRAHPYDIPDYLPSIFEHLEIHLNDPQPIPTTIRAVLGDFKRTHYDGWNGINGHVQHFTEQQLVILQDLLIPASYYA
ncbi:hypothetical protein M0802_010697 [Mischocyttarus mexicanus]|nr:hypothetical protein M0802_010697 [Mischocyttarus mexicanus]